MALPQLVQDEHIRKAMAWIDRESGRDTSGPKD